jgi:hypothetical protein
MSRLKKTIIKITVAIAALVGFSFIIILFIPKKCNDYPAHDYSNASGVYWDYWYTNKCNCIGFKIKRECSSSELDPDHLANECNSCIGIIYRSKE